VNVSADYAADARAIVTEDRSNLRNGLRQMIADDELADLITDALHAAYHEGGRNALMGTSLPPLRLGIELAKQPIGRVLPRIRDDLGRDLPGVTAVSIETDLEAPDVVTVKLLVDGEQVRLVAGPLA
jgi:hypothetical protein